MQGCLIAFAIIMILGLIIQYWPIALAILAMYLIYKWETYKKRNVALQKYIPINDEQIILCAGKYRGGQNIPVGIYNLKILSGTGIIQTNKPDKIFERLESNAEIREKRNWPDCYNGVIVTEETILDISESAKIKFMFASKSNGYDKNVEYITHGDAIMVDNEMIKETNSENDLDITDRYDNAIKVECKFIEEPQPKINLDTMEGHEFEYFCAGVLRENGYESVYVTKGSGDQGVDITAERDGIKYAIQCKRYAQPVGNKAVQEIYAGRKFYHCHVGIIMTNNYFTASAKELARENGIILWDKEHLHKFLNGTETETKQDYCTEEQSFKEFNLKPVTNEELQDKSIVKEKNIKTQEKKDMYDKEHGIYPSGVYVVGEDIEKGTYLLECEKDANGYIAFYESYSNFIKNDILDNLNFSDQYHIPLRKDGMVIEIQNIKTVRKI